MIKGFENVCCGHHFIKEMMEKKVADELMCEDILEVMKNFTEPVYCKDITEMMWGIGSYAEYLTNQKVSVLLHKLMELNLVERLGIPGEEVETHTSGWIYPKDTYIEVNGQRYIKEGAKKVFSMDLDLTIKTERAKFRLVAEG